MPRVSGSPMKAEKLVSLKEAIHRFVVDGASIAMGTSQETQIPFAAGHEIIRQNKRRLTLIGPISDILFDQMIGAGCVKRVRAGWVGNVITGSAYNFRRAVETGQIQCDDYSVFTLAMALKAGALGIPFIPTKSALGSDLYQTNPGLKLMACPYTDTALTAVRALRPDIAIIHVQRCDVDGNAHMWGNLGITREACLASRKVIITTESVVPSDIILSDPNRVLTPGYRVSAVVHAPWGGHPSPVPGFYNRDHQSFIDYRDQSRSPEAYQAWKAEWVDNIQSTQDYLNKLGPERMQALGLTQHLFSEPVDYGY